MSTNPSFATASKLDRLVWALGISGMLSAPASAGALRELDQTIFGMDCAPCAAGIEKGLTRLPGVTSVRVSLNEGTAVVALAPDSRTTLAQIREVIRHNGFTPKDARATLVGRVVKENGRLSLRTAEDRFLLDAGSALSDSDAAANVDRDMTLSVRVPEHLANPPTVQLITVQPGR